MTDTYQYVLDVNNKVQTMWHWNVLRLAVSSPLALRPLDLQMLLFEKVVQKQLEYRTRDFEEYRERELKGRGPRFKEIFRNLDDIVVAFYPHQLHKQPQHYASIADVKEVPAGIGWRVRVMPGMVESLLPRAPYLPFFENLAADEKQEHISQIFMAGGPAACDAKLDERCGQECAVLRARGSEKGAPPQVIEENVRLTQQKYAFIKVLATVFSARELKEMSTYLAYRRDVDVRCLEKMVQHTSTIYLPETPRSYGAHMEGGQVLYTPTPA